jgi:acyl-CoA synthetase (AMP-forming)/AMP-acid ligase II
VIANPDGAEVADGTVGEIWLYGNNIARGYFRREEETRRVFGNRLQSRLPDGSHAEGAPEDSYWLATGDLGVYVDGELYLTGRIKDLIIIDGSNHYPHDIETTVSEASTAIRTGYVAAVSRKHHIRLANLKLVAAGAIPRTTSGKLARNACRAAYIAGRFNR